MTRATHADRPYRAPAGAPNRAPRVPFAVLIVGLAVGGMALLLALNTASAANELRRHELAAKDQNVSDRLQQVRNQVAASAAPGNLGRAARALGMVPAVDPAFLVLGSDGTVHLLGSPGAAQAPAAPAPKTSKKPKPKPRVTSTTPKRGAGARTTPARSKRSPHPTRSSGSTRRTTGTPKPTHTPPPTVTLGGDR